MTTLKWGTEKLVNTTTAGIQGSCEIAGLVGGGFVAVWEPKSGTGTKAEIRAQRFDATGVKVGSEIVIFAPSESDARVSTPHVTGLADGGFFVSWTNVTTVWLVDDF